jgi:hypothetical protein
MTRTHYVVVVGLTTALVGGLRYWLTRSRKPIPVIEALKAMLKRSGAQQVSESGTAVSEGTGKERGTVPNLNGSTTE